MEKTTTPLPATANGKNRWWRITRPGHVTLTVCMSPALTQDEAKAAYPGAYVDPMTDDEVDAWQAGI